MTQDRKIAFTVIGCGHIGKRHAEMITRNSHCKLVGLVDIKDEEDLKLGHFKVPFFKSIEDFFHEDSSSDVVVIATPNGLHAEHAIQCLEHTYHVVIEKPMALTKSDAEKVIFKALNVSKHVFTVMQNRYSPPSVWIKGLMDDKKLGKIYSVHINSFWNRDDRYYTGKNWHGTKKLDGGTLFTQFSHFIDIMYWLFGDIKNINAILKDCNHQNLTDFEDSNFNGF